MSRKSDLARTRREVAGMVRAQQRERLGELERSAANVDASRALRGLPPLHGATDEMAAFGPQPGEKVH